MKCLLNRIITECKCFTKQGHVATYIPELARRLSDNVELGIDMSVYQSEKLTATKTEPLHIC